ncbi:MAG: DUF167 domain-containing protein [Anaerolineales bacterium]|nr:DUF167 domain-containing protein [Anaerolineales bacterium]
MPRNFFLHQGQRGSALAVRVTPRASRNEIVSLLDDGTIKVNLASDPADEEMNNELVSFLAEALGVPKTRVEIVAGENSRDKLISVLDMDAETVHQRILSQIE